MFLFKKQSCVPISMLIKTTAKMIGLEGEENFEIISKMIKEQSMKEKLVLYSPKTNTNTHQEQNQSMEWVYDPKMYKYEEDLAIQIGRIKNGRFPFPYINTDSMTSMIEKEMSTEFSLQQKEAIKLAFKNNLLIITGGLQFLLFFYYFLLF